MIQKLFLKLITLLVISSNLYAQKYPTVWIFENKSNDNQSISCIGRAPGLDGKLSVNMDFIKKNGTVTHKWSQYHNDGLGLNAANWECRSKNSSVKFISSWGEKLTFILENQNIKIIHN